MRKLQHIYSSVQDTLHPYGEIRAKPGMASLLPVPVRGDGWKEGRATASDISVDQDVYILKHLILTTDRTLPRH